MSIGEDRATPQFAVEDLFLLLDNGDAEDLFDLAKALPVPTGNERVAKLQRLDRQNTGIVAASLVPVARQLDMIRELAASPGFERNLSNLLESLTENQVVEIINSVPKEHANGWLYYIESVSDKTVEIDADRLLELARCSEEAVRTAAMELLYSFGSNRLKCDFAAGDWHYSEAGSDRRECIIGSLLLAEFAKHLTFSELADRISPELLPEAVEHRGIIEEELTAVAEILVKRLDAVIYSSD